MKGNPLLPLFRAKVIFCWGEYNADGEFQRGLPLGFLCSDEEVVLNDKHGATCFDPFNFPLIEHRQELAVFTKNLDDGIMTILNKAPFQFRVFPYTFAARPTREFKVLKTKHRIFLVIQNKFPPSSIFATFSFQKCLPD